MSEVSDSEEKKEEENLINLWSWFLKIGTQCVHVIVQ